MAKVSLRLVAYSTIGTLFGVLVTPFAIRLAGHGDGWALGNPVFLPLLYPYSMLLMAIPSAAVSTLCMVLAVCQFPLYGLLLGDAAAAGAKRFAWTAMWIGLSHGIALAPCAVIWRFS